MRRGSLGFQHEQKRCRAEQLMSLRLLEAAVLGKLRRAFKKLLSPIETELLAAA
jgi:hypothetical protein